MQRKSTVSRSTLPTTANMAVVVGSEAQVPCQVPVAPGMEGVRQRPPADERTSILERKKKLMYTKLHKYIQIHIYINHDRSRVMNNRNIIKII